MEEKLKFELQQRIEIAKLSQDNITILNHINFLNKIFFNEFGEDLKINAQLEKFNEELRGLIEGYKQEQNNLNMLGEAPKMSGLIFKKSQEYLNFMGEVLEKIEDGKQE